MGGHKNKYKQTNKNIDKHKNKNHKNGKDVNDLETVRKTIEFPEYNDRDFIIIF